ncbi:MAG: hypothetical protein JO013_14030 [Alphaproteobacteria bacterium]|nr:hypothetical protein [Alphaproteobacteria bacterium]
MGSLSFRLAKALQSGRAERRLTRERILLDLLNKRAAARQAGLADLEAQLREQIRWALPVHEGGKEREADAATAPPRNGEGDQP